ncbi:platelet glycoprotein V-like [Procambarus clarkii]|uniref:platelet glycoprotein V-like n=1 Tax=Procambarus clarkii TaxID=6728 RepID=UPI0037438C0A
MAGMTIHQKMKAATKQPGAEHLRNGTGNDCNINYNDSMAKHNHNESSNIIITHHNNNQLKMMMTVWLMTSLIIRDDWNCVPGRGLGMTEWGHLIFMDKYLASLELLDVSSNKLAELPTDLWSLTNLTHLYLGDNKLSDAHTFNISNLINLEVLDLHLNQLSQLPPLSVEPLRALQILHLHWNTLVELPVLINNLHLHELLVNGNALLEFPKYMFGNLTQPLTYHFVDNPAYDVWATMLLALPERSHIMMGNDVWVWAEDDQVARQLLQQSQTWVLQDGLSQPIDLPSLVRICGSTHIAHNGGSLLPC